MKIKVFIGILAMVTFLSACYKDNGEESDIPLFSANENIINPPDSFRLVMTLRNNLTTRTFFRDSTSSVWAITKQQAQSSRVWMVRSTQPDSSYEISQDTLGLEAGAQYEIYGNNNNYGEERKVYLKFVQLPIDYASFNNKL